MPNFTFHVLEDVTEKLGSSASAATEAVSNSITTVASGVVTTAQKGTVSVSWWSSYPLLMTFLIVLLTTAVLLFAAIITMIILENKSHKMQIQLLMGELSKVYEKNGIKPEQTSGTTEDKTKK